MTTVLGVMKSVDQWHLWRMESGQKIPYQVDGVNRAKSNDPETWSSWSEAVESLDRLGDGWELAFTLGERGLFTGIDFDDAYDSDGLGQTQPRDWAVEVFDAIKDRCYAETSPSGTGFKAIILGQKPDGARCRLNKGQGKQAIEIYDHNRFWAFTGDIIVDKVDAEGAVYYVNEGVVKLAGLSQERVESQAIPFEFAPAVPADRRGSKFSKSETLAYRAQSYLNSVRSSGSLGEGSRNNTIFSASGHIISMGIPRNEALEMILGFNASLPSPLSEAEATQAFNSACRNGTPRDYKGDNNAFVADATKAPKDTAIDYVLMDPNFIKDVPERSEALYRADDAQEQLPVELMKCRGFISTAMEWIMARQNEVHPEMAFSAAIHLASLALSRKWTDDSCYETTTNAYSLVLADSGAGKDVPRKMIKKFLCSVDRDDLIGPSAIDSGAGLVAALMAKPSMSMLLDECGELFSNLANDRCPPHFRKVGTVLKAVYSSATDKRVQLRALAQNDMGQNDPISFPHLHIFATATPKQVLGTISDSQIEDGLLGRFSMFFGSNDPKVQRGRNLPIPEEMKAWFKKWDGSESVDSLSVDGSVLSDATEVEEMRIMSRTSEAEERLESHFEKISEKRRQQNRDGSSLPEQAIWNRASEKTAKLAMIFAASRGSQVISLDDANRAIAVNNHLTRRVVKVYRNRAKSEYAEKRAAVLLTLTTKMTSEALFNRMNSSIDPRMRQTIVEDLIASREISSFIKGKKTYFCLGSMAN